MTILTPGANTPLADSNVTLEILHGEIAGTGIDVSAFQLGANGKVRGDHDMCFYNQPKVGGGAVELQSSSGGTTRFAFDLSRVDSAVEKIVVAATIHENQATFGALREVRMSARMQTSEVSGVIECSGRPETALILAEVYRRQGQWKLRVVGQGFVGGLAALAPHFGVEVADSTPTPVPQPTPAPQPTRTSVPAGGASQPKLDMTRRPSSPPAPPAPQPAPAKPINLSKISLTKQNSTISLKKSDGKFGQIRVNLNWNQKPNGGGFMSSLMRSSIDLDLGCLIEDQYGNRTCVQALGNTFGDYAYFPYAKLRGDDRTGAVSDGEWLDINGEMWGEINRILIFAFIYEGVPDWRHTDAVVRLMVPDQPEVEVRLNEYGSRDGMCALALLENQGGRIDVSREVKFFKSHRFMDEAYGWGMNWRAGSK